MSVDSAPEADRRALIAFAYAGVLARQQEGQMSGLNERRQQFGRKCLQRDAPSTYGLTSNPPPSKDDLRAELRLALENTARQCAAEGSAQKP